MSDELTRTEKLGVLARQIDSLGFGAFVANEQITEVSGYVPETQEFSFFITGIRNQLVEHGKWLSGEGQEGKGFFVVRPSENAVVSSRYTNKANRVLQVMQTLLEKTPMDELTEAERRRHRKELRELRYSNRLVERREEVLEIVKKHKPGLLKQDIESE